MIRNVFRKLGSLRSALAVGVSVPFLIASAAVAQTQAPTRTAPAAGGAGGGEAATLGTTAETERVLVTGSYIPRAADEIGPDPVDTLSTQEIAKTGEQTTDQIFKKTPSVTGAHVGDNNTNGGQGATTVNLRGLGAQQTLVLVDGRRVAPIGFAGTNTSFDLNLVPLALIDRIEIVKDGASAIYGSDAVAGVVNVILKKQYRGLEIGGTYGNTTNQDAAVKSGYILAGLGDDKTNVVVFASDYDRAGLFSRDRDLSSTGDFRRLGGQSQLSGSFPGRLGSFILKDPTKTPTAKTSGPSTSPDYRPLNRGSLGEPLSQGTDLFNFQAFTPAIAASDRQAFYGSFDREICEKNLIMFGDFEYARTFFDGSLAPTPINFNQEPDNVNNTATIVIPATNAFNPFGKDFKGGRYRSLELGPRTDKITADDYRFTVGFKGTLPNGWNWETGVRYSEDRRSEVFGGELRKSTFINSLFDTNPATAFNPFAMVPGNAAVLQRAAITTQHTGKTTLLLEDARLNGDIVKIPGGPITFAIGVEHRKETGSDSPDSLTASFDTIGATNFSPTSGNRDVWSTYGEINVPITGGDFRFPGFYSTEVSFAERYDYFSDFGDSEKPKFSLRWQPIDKSLTLRATYSEGFVAPSLGQLFQSTAESFQTVNDPAGLTADPQIRTLLGGNKGLQPQTSYGWSYGFVYTPTYVKGLTVSMDYYHIDVRGAIGSSPQFEVDQNFITRTGTDAVTGAPTGGTFSDRIVRDPTTGELLTVSATNLNLSRIVTEGFDYEAIYELNSTDFSSVDFGKFTFTLNATHVRKFKQVNTPGSPILELAGKFVDPTTDSFSPGSIPRNRGYFSTFWDYRGFETGVTINYVGAYHDDPNATYASGVLGVPVDRQISEWITTDLQASYEFHLPAPATEQKEVAGYSKGGKNVRESKDGKNVQPVSTANYDACSWRTWLNGTGITVGVDNVFDIAPPFAAGAFENGYDESVHDIRGRFYYVSVKKKF